MKSKIKSCIPILNKTGWVARVRTTDGREVFIGINAGYTLHQAQVLCDSISRDAALHGIDAALS